VTATECNQDSGDGDQSGPVPPPRWTSHSPVAGMDPRDRELQLRGSRHHLTMAPSSSTAAPNREFAARSRPGCDLI
jgi:hypothetical protein